MKKTFLFVILSVLFLSGIFFAPSLVRAELDGVSVTLVNPQMYNPDTGVVTVCKSGGIRFSGQFTVYACDNNSQLTYPLYFSLVPLDQLNAVDGDGNPTGTPESGEVALGSLSIAENINEPVSFSGFFDVPDNLASGFYNAKVSLSVLLCPKGGGDCYPVTAAPAVPVLLSDCDCPPGFALQQDGTCIKTTIPDPVIYSTDDCPPDSAKQDGVCVKSNATTNTYSTDNCPPGSGILDGICVNPAVSNCAISGPASIDKGATADFGLNYSNMGGVPDFTANNPVCGTSGSLVSHSCDASCAFSCTYDTAGGPYDVSAEIQSGSNKAQCVTTISVNFKPPPDAQGLQSLADYCSSGSGAGSVALSWTYTNSSGNNETKFDFQVDDDSNFSSPVVSNLAVPATYPPDTSNNQTAIIKTNPGLGELSFGTPYFWQVKVYDDDGYNSDWLYGGTFTTEDHAYPAPAFSFSPSSAPLIDNKDTVTFVDGPSTCYNADGSSYQCKDPDHSNTYGWWFEDLARGVPQGTPDDSTVGDTTHDYTNYGTYYPKLNVCDDVGCCYASGTVRVVNPYGVPEWVEISPF